MTTNLDMKNGEFFEAATEALYQSKIEELQAEIERITRDADGLRRLLTSVEKENDGYIADLTEKDREIERLKAELWVANDSRLRTYDGMVQDLTTAVEALEKCTQDLQYRGDYIHIATEALARIREGSE